MATSRIIYPNRVSTLSQLNRTLHSAPYKDARFYLLVDENTYNNCLPYVIAKVSAFEDAEFVEIPVGEEAKTLEIANQLWLSLAEFGAGRNDVLVNIGGGALSDVGGFVAGTYMRGMRTINIPTSLVGMIDASIGGKTALNINGFKNQVGIFHHPEIICIEPDFLDTLPQGELLSGVFEMCKTFAISDPEKYDSFVSLIEQNNIRLDLELIRSCIEVKEAVVAYDPNDHGTRHILNFGHTFGHAVESYSISCGNALSHGESVAIGMACAMFLSSKLLGFPENEYIRWKNLVAQNVTIPHYTLSDTEKLLEFMRQDKKNAEGNILCVLLQNMACPVIDFAVSENLIRDAFLTVCK